MTIRPQDLPELRAELVKTIASQCDQFHIEGSSRMWPVETLNQAELYHVSPSMTELAQSARDSLEMFTPDIHDVPSACGMVYFAGGTGDIMTFSCGKDGGTARGAFWVRDEKALLVLPFGDDHPDSAGNIPTAPLVYHEARYYVPLDGSKVIGASTNPTFTTERFTAILLTAWLLMQQPLAETPTVDVDRATKKRLRRIGQEPAPVRVIELRRPKTGSGPGDSERGYQHQWVVRGHWRQHWYPKRQVHRPVWIAPHIKGPEGAPLIGGEKVYALKR